MIGAGLGQLLIAVVVTGLLLSGRIWLWALLVAAFTEGALGVLHQLAERAAVLTVVPREQLPAALTGNEARTRGAAIAGQPLGSGLVALGASLPYAAAAVSQLASVICLFGVRGKLQQKRTGPCGPARHRDPRGPGVDVAAALPAGRDDRRRRHQRPLPGPQPGRDGGHPGTARHPLRSRPGALAQRRRRARRRGHRRLVEHPVPAAHPGPGRTARLDRLHGPGRRRPEHPHPARRPVRGERLRRRRLQRRRMGSSSSGPRPTNCAVAPTPWPTWWVRAPWRPGRSPCGFLLESTDALRTTLALSAVMALTALVALASPGLREAPFPEPGATPADGPGNTPRKRP